MVQSGQVARAAKKAADAKPKVSTKKLLKDAALTAVMFAGPGKFIKGAKVAKEGVVAAERLARRARGGSATASRMQKASKSTDASRREAKRRAENAVKEARVESARVPRPTRTVKQDVIQRPIRKPLERIPSTKAVALEPKPNVGGGLKTTTGQGRKPLPDKDASDISKEINQRPNNSGRVKDVKKPSSKELSPSEKAADIASKKSPVTVTKKKPMSSAEIKKTRATARKAKFDRVLTLRPKPKPNRAPLKPIRKPVLQPAAAARAKRAEPKTTKPSDAPSIEKGRGDTLQLPSVTTSRIRSVSRQINRERRKAKQANLRDKRTDIREASTPGFEKLQSVRRGVPRNAAERAEGRANAEARAALAAKAKKGSKMSKRSTTNDPRNTASDAGNMRERLKAIDKLTAANKKAQAIGKGGNKISRELKAKVNATLGSSKRAKKSRQLQNTFNKPKFSRNVTTGRLRATRPIKPTKK